MNLNHKWWLGIVTGATLFLAACEKNLLDENVVEQKQDLGNSSLFKFIHAYTDTLPTVTARIGPQVWIYNNGKRLNGTTLTFAGVWPSSNYSAITNGAGNFEFIMNRVVSGTFQPTPADVVWKYNTLIQPGKTYSLFLTDTFPAKNVMVVEDDLTPPPSYSYKVRLVNLSYTNRNDVLEVYSRRQGKVVVTGGAYKQMSDWVQLNTTQPATDTFDVRLAGTTANLYFTTFTPVSGRMYTIFTRGGRHGRTNGASFYTNR